MSILYAKRAMHTEWETPAHIFQQLDREFAFHIDAAASAENTKCGLWFSESDDGLSVDWGDASVWLNPPYGDKNLRRWVAKACDAALKGATVVCFLPVNASSVWWNKYAPLASEIRWVQGRVKFVGARAGAPFASCIMIFRPRAKPLVAGGRR